MLAIAAAWANWQAGATLTAVSITGPIANGGVLNGPPLAPLILGGGMVKTPQEQRLVSAVAGAVGAAFATWQATVKAVAAAWYPAFAQFPGPVAPPTPNVPVPLATLMSFDGPIQALPTQIVAQFGDPNEQRGNAVCTAIGSAIGAVFNQWKLTTMVTNVIATGTVAGYDKDTSPTGPVVGVGNMTPGGFA